MVLNGKPVCFILDSGNKTEAFRMPVNRNLHVLIVQPPGPVIVIFDHAADRNRKSQLRQNLFCNVYLPPAAIHHQDVREPGKASEVLFHSLLL